MVRLRSMVSESAALTATVTSIGASSRVSPERESGGQAERDPATTPVQARNASFPAQDTEV